MERVLKEVVVAKNLTRCCVKNVLEMILLNEVQDFEMGSVRAVMPWVCAKHVFRSYLGNEERRSEDEVDGGLTKVIILKGNRGCTNHICEQ